MTNKPDLLRIDPDVVNVLCAVNAEILSGDVRLEISHTQLRWYEPGRVRWIFRVTEAASYRVSLAIAARYPASFNVVIDGTESSGSLTPTNGYFSEPSNPVNFERIEAVATISLGPGTHELDLKITPEGDPPAISIGSIELTPVGAVRAPGADRRDNGAAGSDDWFTKSGYGVMVHWTSQSAPRSGPITPYAEAVDRFDVEAFADSLADMGASYVMLTANHADPTFPAPIASWERFFPGRTTKRDLVADLIRTLARREIRLFLYLNTFAAYITTDRVRNVDGSTGFRNDVRMVPDCRSDYLEMSCEVLREIGTRYGDSLAGYWFDSWYQPFMHFGSFPMREVYDAARVGNPNRLVTFNWWILPVGTPWVDYWAGEVGALTVPPPDRFPDYGPGRGIQHHTLLIMDDPWVHEGIDTPIAPPGLDADRLVDFVAANRRIGAPVTINLGIYQDGGFGPESVRLMERLK